MATKRKGKGHKGKPIPGWILAVTAIALLIGSVISYIHEADNTIQTAAPDGELSVTYLSVGQGDSTLITAPDGSTLLLDAATADGVDDLLRELTQSGVTTIDYFILTHNHEDHIAGADDVFETFHVSNVIFSGRESYDSAGYRKMTEAAAAEEGCTILYAEDFDGGRDSFALGSATVTVIASPLYPDDNENNNSQVVRLDYGTTVFLFMGDAEEEEEKALLETYGASLFDADVLKFGHHGSSTSSCETFLDAVSPTMGVVSCGSGNEYGHPHGETLEKASQRGITVRRTDTEGNVCLTSNGSRVQSVSLTAHLSPWSQDDDKRRVSKKLAFLHAVKFQF